MNTSGKHYEWQLFDGHQWLQIENDNVIECNYCQPGAKGMTINTLNGSLYIDYDDMAIKALQYVTFPGLAVRRLLSLPHNQRENMGWYYKENNYWCEYGLQGPSNSMSSINCQDIEKHYNSNPTGSVRFTAGKYSYTLNFSVMMQNNMSTGKQRKVRRRPKFNSVICVNHSLDISEPFGFTIHQSSSASAIIPSASASTEVTWQFMGDEGMWTEYQKPSSSLDSSDVEREYQRNPQGQISFIAGCFSYSLNFNGMYQINLTYKTRRAVRRVSADESSSTLCQAHWQFKDMDGCWKDFVKGTGRGKCTVSIQEIEMQYQQNTAGILYYSSEKFSYKLDFSEMMQTNLSTGKRRPVRRV